MASQMLSWQIARFGKSRSARFALHYFRERGWPVDDYAACDDALTSRIYAFMSGFNFSQRLKAIAGEDTRG